MGARRTVLTAGLVVVAVVTGMWVRAWAQGPPAVGIIVLAMVDNSCEKYFQGNDPKDKNKIHVKKGKSVKWKVVNNTCPSNTLVELKDWSSSPPPVSGTLSCGSASIGAGECTFSGKATAAVGTYSYTVWVGGKPTKDPDLIIDP